MVQIKYLTLLVKCTPISDARHPREMLVACSHGDPKVVLPHNVTLNNLATEACVVRYSRRCYFCITKYDNFPCLASNHCISDCGRNLSKISVQANDCHILSRIGRTLLKFYNLNTLVRINSMRM